VIKCPRCESPVDESTRNTCPICLSPLTAAPAPFPQAPTASATMAAGPAPAAGPSPMRTSLTGEQFGPTAPERPFSQPPGYAQGAPQNTPTLSQGQSAARRPVQPPYARREVERAPAEGAGLGARIAVFLVLVACFAGGGWWLWLHRTNPKGQMQHYLHATQWLDWGVVWDLSSPKPGGMARHEFVSTMNNTFDDNPLYKIAARRNNEKIRFTVSEPEYKGEAAIVKVSIADSPYKRDAPVVFQLRDFGGDWKVTPMEDNPLQVIGAEPTKAEKEAQERKLRQEIEDLAAPKSSRP